MEKKKDISIKQIILRISLAAEIVAFIIVALFFGFFVWGFTSEFKHYPLISYVSMFGPNDNANNSYYYYAKNEEKFKNLTICKYDIRTGEEEVVFSLDDGNSHKSISDYYGDDDNLFVVVTGKLSTNGRHSLYYHDNRSGKDQIITEVFGKIHLVRTETGIIVGIPDGYESSELKYYDLSEDESGFKLIETDKPNSDSTGLTSVSSSHRVMLDDGRSVVFSKNNGEANYSYSIDGKSGDIKDLTSKNALRSGVYNHFLVEGDKVIGAVEFTEWRHGGIGPKNMLETRDLKGSALFEFDINTYESKILYEIEGNKTQIIGYKEGQIYLYRKGKIIKRSLDGYGEKVICSVRKNKHQLSFNWLNDTLVIFDKDDCKVVGSCNG